KSIDIDPGLASAYGMAAWCYVRRKANGWMTDRSKEIAEAARLARQAVRLGKEDAVALSMGGYALAFMVHNFDDAAAFMDRALVVNPNLAMVWNLSGWLRVWRGEPEPALAHVAHAVRLSPLDPSIYGLLGAMAYAHFLAHRYGEAVSCAEMSMRGNPNFLLSICNLAASSAMAGRLDQAQNAVARIRQLDPEYRIADLEDRAPFRRSEDLAKYTEGLRRAGLPE